MDYSKSFFFYNNVNMFCISYNICKSASPVQIYSFHFAFHIETVIWGTDCAALTSLNPLGEININNKSS